jgi:transposase
MGRITVIAGGERRRRWSAEDRARILAAIAEPDAVVAEVARREDVCTSLVYKWRRAARREESAVICGFSPVILEPAPAVSISRETPTPEAAPSVIEIELKDVRVKIGAAAPSAVIAATLRALRS